MSDFVLCTTIHIPWMCFAACGRKNECFISKYYVFLPVICVQLYLWMFGIFLFALRFTVFSPLQIFLPLSHLFNAHLTIHFAILLLLPRCISGFFKRHDAHLLFHFKCRQYCCLLFALGRLAFFQLFSIHIRFYGFLFIFRWRVFHFSGSGWLTLKCNWISRQWLLFTFCSVICYLTCFGRRCSSDFSVYHQANYKMHRKKCIHLCVEIYVWIFSRLTFPCFIMSIYSLLLLRVLIFILPFQFVLIFHAGLQWARMICPRNPFFSQQHSVTLLMIFFKAKWESIRLHGSCRLFCHRAFYCAPQFGLYSVFQATSMVYPTAPSIGSVHMHGQVVKRKLNWWHKKTTKGASCKEHQKKIKQKSVKREMNYSLCDTIWLDLFYLLDIQLEPSCGDFNWYLYVQFGVCQGNVWKTHSIILARSAK